MLDNNRLNDDVEYMLTELSEDELEIAARTSYQYVKDPTLKRKHYAASRMAERYLKSKKSKERGLKFLTATLEFREKMDIDALRNAATDPQSEYHIPMRKFLATKQCYVSGKDIDGRSTFIFIPRRVKDHDLEWTRKSLMYTMERAIACSEIDTSTVNCVVDFSGFRMSQAPPIHIGKDIMLTLRNHYVGHVHCIFLVDAPRAFHWLWAIFKPFAGKATQDKIHFVNSDRQKEIIIGKLYGEDQVPSWMLPTGKKNRELDLDEYLKTPFDRAFDD